MRPLAEFSDSVRENKTLIENERCGLFFAKTGSINSGTGSGSAVRKYAGSGFALYQCGSENLPVPDTSSLL